MTGLLKCQKSSRETHPRDVIILLVGQVHLLHGADRVLATVLVYPLPVSKQHVLHCEITNHTLGSLLTLDVCYETFLFHVRRLPYMTSATFSDFLTPSLPCHCHKSADVVPFVCFLGTLFSPTTVDVIYGSPLLNFACTGLPAYCDKTLIVTVQSSKMISNTV